jgi:hypothetical protein
MGRGVGFVGLLLDLLGWLLELVSLELLRLELLRLELLRLELLRLELLRLLERLLEVRLRVLRKVLLHQLMLERLMRDKLSGERWCTPHGRAHMLRVRMLPLWGRRDPLLRRATRGSWPAIRNDSSILVEECVHGDDIYHISQARPL